MKFCKKCNLTKSVLEFTKNKKQKMDYAHIARHVTKFLMLNGIQKIQTIIKIDIRKIQKNKNNIVKNGTKIIQKKR